MSFNKGTATLGIVQSMDVGRLYASVSMLDEAEQWKRKAADKGYESAKNDSNI